MSEQLLDVDLIARRRTELGMSQRALGREAGLNSAAASQLEAGTNHAEMTLRSATRIAKALGLPLRALFAAPVGAEVPEPRADDIVVETLLVSLGQTVQRHEIAQVLSWDLERVGKAISALCERLDGTGVVVHRASSGYTIRPRGDLLRDDELRQLERFRMRTRQVREPAMRLLLEIATRGLPRNWSQHAGNADRVNLRMLINSGLVIETEAGFTPATDLVQSLKL